MFICRLTDRQTFAVAFEVYSINSLINGCKQVFIDRSKQYGTDIFDAKTFINSELRRIDEWEARQLEKPGRSDCDIFAISQQARAWRANAQKGLKYGKQAVNVDVLPCVLELHVFARHGQCRLENLIHSSTGWIATGDYDGKNIGSMKTSTDGTYISLGIKKRYEGSGSVKIYSGRAPDDANKPDNHVGIADGLERWRIVFNKCLMADEHDKALSAFCSNVEKMVMEKPEDPDKPKFIVITGGKDG